MKKNYFLRLVFEKKAIAKKPRFREGRTAFERVERKMEEAIMPRWMLYRREVARS